jgi:hypothetical protein
MKAIIAPAVVMLAAFVLSSCGGEPAVASPGAPSVASIAAEQEESFQSYYQQSKGDVCDPSYPGVCIAPPPPDLACEDLPYRNFAVIGSDPHDFDADGNGIGCEGWLHNAGP